MTGLSDSFSRPIDYLRLSVTDRCNLRCIYCMPPEGIPLMDRAEVLSYEEMAEVVRAAVELGISKVRLTGGEPLVRSDLAALVAMLARIEGIGDLALTTNGVFLAGCAVELKRAGLRRVNVSLDSLRRDRFQAITRADRRDEVLAGIEAARAVGLDPVKVNVVVMRGINDDELLDFGRLAMEEGWHVRFIELMPFSSEAASLQFMPAAEMKRRLSGLGRLEPWQLEAGNGPARYFRPPGARGSIGFITPVSEHFCFGCNRLRLTAEGGLRPCLLSEAEVDVKTPLRAGASREELKGLIQKAVSAKPRGHQLSQGRRGQSMSRIGG